VLRFSLSEAAEVKIDFVRKRQRLEPVEAGRITRDLRAGRHSIRFGCRRFRRGRHVATFVATDASGNRSQPETLGFRVVWRARR
jgi:hypothetical protein